VIKLLFAIICYDIIGQVCRVNEDFQSNSVTAAGWQYTSDTTRFEHYHLIKRLQKSGYSIKDQSLQTTSIFTSENLTFSTLSNQEQKLHLLTLWDDDPIFSAINQCENNFPAQLATIISPTSLFSIKTGFHIKNMDFNGRTELFAGVKIAGTRHDIEIIPRYEFFPKTDAKSVCLDLKFEPDQFTNKHFWLLSRVYATNGNTFHDLSMIEGNVNFELRDFTICLVAETLLQGSNDYKHELRLSHECYFSGDYGNRKTIVRN